MIDSDTVCLNCHKPFGLHCSKHFHFLKCCPGRCEAEPNSHEHFYPPQPARWSTNPEGVRVLVHAADAGWAP